MYNVCMVFKKKYSIWFQLILGLLCGLLNMFGSKLAEGLSLPIFNDTLFTVLASFFGWTAGITSALGYHILFCLFIQKGFSGFLFVICSLSMVLIVRLYIKNVEIEGVVFTHEKNLSFNNLKKYAEEKYNFDKDIKSKGYGDDDFASCLLVNSDAKLKNVAILDSLTYGITLAKTKGTIEDSIISHCNDICLYCVEKTEATVQKTKIINSRYSGVYAIETSNPSLKDCEIYGNGWTGICVKDQARGTYTKCHIHDNQGNGLIISGSSTPSVKDCEIYGNGWTGICVKDQARGTYTNCHIHDNEGCGLNIGGSSTPSFEDCKIHDNKKEGCPGVVVKESSNPSLKDCEIYGHLSNGIWVKDQASGTYKNCYLHNNKGANFSNETSNTIDTSTCRMG